MEHRIAHNPTFFDSLRIPTVDDPLRVLVSACMAGHPVGIDGTHFGMKGAVDPIVTLPTIRMFTFCPEDAGIGTPRTMPDIHGGDGFDALDGNARVLDQHGEDLTARMIVGAQRMVERARQDRVELAILTDASAACGTQVISDGCRYNEVRTYTAGVGVAAAMLIRNNIPVVSQRDYAALEQLMKHAGAEITVTPGRLNHHETPWYREYFG
jgi:uncharacterized protein YbbK (DUF523 family)